MEINPSLTRAGMVNIRSEEWGEARTAEQGEQSASGVPALPKMCWNRPKQDVAGLLGLPSAQPDLQPPWPSRLPSESFHPTVTWRSLIPSPGLPACFMNLVLPNPHLFFPLFLYILVFIHICVCWLEAVVAALSCHLSPRRGWSRCDPHPHGTPAWGKPGAPAPCEDGRKEGWKRLAQCSSTLKAWKKHSERNCACQIMPDSGFTCSCEQSRTLWTLWVIIPDNFVLCFLIFYTFIHFFLFIFSIILFLSIYDLRCIFQYK